MIRRALGIGLFLGLTAIAASAQERPNKIELDTFFFSQRDRGGHPLQAEGFEYYAGRGSLDLLLRPGLRFHLEGTLAYIGNDSSLAVPPTVTNATTTSASANLVTLDALTSLEIKPRGSAWTWRPGFYYHHQSDNQSAGVDLGFTRELNDGDSQLSFTYSVRFDHLLLDFWDGSQRGTADRWTHNVLIGWTELLTPDWKGYLGLQYTFQKGFLEETYNFVPIYDAGGVPRLYVDESLPNDRHRAQVNGRLRYSWATGKSAGLDASVYGDDWHVVHAAIEPSYETRFGRDVRWRVWYRFSVQDGARYFRKRPQASERFITRDSDLGSFAMHSPGATISFPLVNGPRREIRLRITTFGFLRDDDLSGFGAKLGLVWTW